MHLSRFRLGLIFAMMAGLAAVCSAAETANAPMKISSAVWDWNKLPVKTNAKGARRDVADAPTATLARFESHVTTLNPGQDSHPPHKHAQEEFIILKDGSVDVHINGKTTHATTGSILFFASNDLHNVTNVGDKPATYLVFNLATGATASAPAEGAAKAALAGKLPSSVFVWETMKPEPKPTGERRQIMD